MRRIIKYLAVLSFVVLLNACSEEPPSVRVRNERSTKANVQFQTVNNTINQNDINAGATTNYQDVPEGRIEVKAEIQSETVAPTSIFNASNDNNYTVVLVNNNPPTIRIDVEGK